MSELGKYTIKELEEICGTYTPDAGKGGCGFHISDGFCNRPERFRCTVYDTLFNGKISVSEANDWMRCRRLYQHKYMDGIEVIPSMLPKPMKIGLLIHQGMAQIVTGKPIQIDYDTYFSPDEIKEKGIIRVILEKAATLPLDAVRCLAEFRFELKLPIDIPQINGVFDVLYSDHFNEIKASGNPDFYLTPHFLQSQLATYFLYNPDLKYCNMQIIRIPALKSSGQYKEEAGEKYVERVREDIEKRPGYYFVGLNDTGWGKKFYRTEFNLKEVIERYRHIMHERRLAIRRDCFYKEETGCLYPSPCMYLQICETGGVSDLIYRKKEIKNSERKGVIE